MSWYRMNDKNPDGMIAIRPSEAKEWNSEKNQCGVFATVNAFDGPRRIENCTAIRAWAVDLDEGTKDEQAEKLRRSPLKPSSVVETARGYHAYWYAEKARTDHYRPLVSRLVDWFGADRNARDVARVLRVPGFYHWKNDPFLIRHVYGPVRSRRYTERQIWRAYPPSQDELKNIHDEARSEYIGSAYIPNGNDVWDRIYNMDQMELLKRLSGSRWVGGEQYKFKLINGNKHNIFVNGKSSPCWIDPAGRIGSPSGGGPTVIQWLHWFGMPKRECLQAVKEICPQLEAQ